MGRLDLCANSLSHEAWLFEESVEPNWAQALRLPLLQGYFANQVGASVGGVSVGIYSFSEANYYLTQFSHQKVMAAFQEAETLARLIDS